MEISLNERLYDANIDYNLVIKNYLDMDYDLRSPMKDDYLRAIYMLMLNSGIPIQTYLKELHIMMVMQHFVILLMNILLNIHLYLKCLLILQLSYMK